MADNTGRESDKFMLRLPDGMRDRIKAVAEANGRSMNAEIVSVLEEKFPPLVMNIEILTQFLESLRELAQEQNSNLREESLEGINAILEQQECAFTVDIDEGRVVFYPITSTSIAKGT